MSAWGDKVIYNMELSQEEKEFSECVDAWARELGRTGHDANHELSALIEKAFTVDDIAAPSELISRMFDESTIGEFDDALITEDPRNTIHVHEAIRAAMLTAALLSTRLLFLLGSLSLRKLILRFRICGAAAIARVANLTTFIKEAFEYKRVAMVMNEIDKMITSGNPNYITESTALPTATSAGCPGSVFAGYVYGWSSSGLYPEQVSSGHGEAGSG